MLNEEADMFYSMFIQQYQGFGKSIQTFEQGRGYYVQKEGVDG